MFDLKAFRSPVLRTLLTIGAAAALTSPALASSEGVRITANKDGTFTARISFADLDLTSAEGRQELDDRVNRSVRRVCSSPFAAYRELRACRDKASSGAAPQVFAAVQRSHTRLAMVQPAR